MRIRRCVAGMAVLAVVGGGVAVSQGATASAAPIGPTDSGTVAAASGGTAAEYPYGGTLVPAGVDADAVVADLYAKWKGQNLVYAPDKGLQSGEILLKSPGGQFGNGMVSEGIGYGLLLSVYNDDKATFDGIWKFGERNLNDKGLLPWLYTSTSQVSSQQGGINNATDGDLDAAFALVAAAEKGWGTDQDAKDLIDAILTHCVHDDDSLERGEANNPKDVINTDYISPAYFTVFEEFTGNTRWTSVKDKNYDVIRTSLDQDGVVLQPQEARVDGVVVNGTNTYNSDTARAPWRLATDYVWFGDDRAKTILTDYNAFFEGAGGGLSNLCESYDRFGAKIGSWCGSDAGWMIGGAASAQLAEDDTASRTEAWNALTTAFTGDYYSFELMQLGVLLAAGKFTNPLQ
ncbi:MAG: glycosyl hydrolase family 8 [Phycicoccus sp.]